MEIIVTKGAGFCFGVKNAIDKAEKLASAHNNVYTYGPIIHNKKVVEDLKEKGIKILYEINEIKPEDTIIIRSHGISKDEFTRIKDKCANIIDATCVNVKKIHRIVEENSRMGYKIIIIGDPDHPEVKGINGWCENSALIINDYNDIEKLVKCMGKLCIVAQTTFNKERWNSIVFELIKKSKEILVLNTICSATELRQTEAMKLSKNVDAMIVVGGQESSNTHKLYEICMENCKRTLFIEDASEIDIYKFKDAKRVGITGGASTPDNVIKGVVDKMNELNNTNEANEEIMEVKEPETIVNEEEVIEVDAANVDAEEKTEDVVEAALEVVIPKITLPANNIEDYFASYKDVHPGSVVVGKVLKVNDKEMFIDISYKSDGLLSIEEASYNQISLKETYKIGDMVEVKVIQMNDGEGNVVLSRKALEKDDFIKQIYKYKEENTQVEVLINGVNKGGLNCQFGDIRGFMPLSLSGIRRDEDTESYKGKRLMANIIDVKERRGVIELLVSRKEIAAEENRAKKKEFFENLECDQVFSGAVKAIINVGAFVKIGEVDVFIPISELSWKRINKPQDIVTEGQMVDIKLIKVDKENMRVTGSIKKMTKEPFEEFISKNKVDDIINGKVARFADFGVFVELNEGIDGLIHISNLSETRINKPQDVVKQGETIKIKIIKIDNDSRKISLSLKDVDKVADEDIDKDVDRDVDKDIEKVVEGNADKDVDENVAENIDKDVYKDVDEIEEN